MDSADLQFVRLAAQFRKLGLQIAAAYNNEQKKLHIERVLKTEHLSSSEGTIQSLEIVRQLRHLTQTHKQAFSKFVVSAIGKLKAVIDEMPAELQEQRKSEFLRGIHMQLDLQSNFYVNRERWINAAEEICNLIQSQRTNCSFTDDGIVFNVDKDLIRYQQLLTVIEESHRAEVEILNDRLARLAKV